MTVSVIKRFNNEFKFEQIETPCSVNTEGANEIMFCIDKTRTKLYINSVFFYHDKFTLKSNNGINQRLHINTI